MNVQSGEKILNKTKSLKTTGLVFSVALTLTGCISFEGYIGLDSSGAVEVVEASTGTPSLGWESYLTESEENFPLINEDGTISGETETKVGNTFDFFVKTSNAFFEDDILNKATVFNEEECSFGADEDIYVHFCEDENIENVNIFNGAIIEGEWLKTYEDRIIYGQTVKTPIYSVEGTLSGLAGEFYENYHNFKTNETVNAEQFLEKINTPHSHDGEEEHTHDYINEPVGTLTIFFNTFESEIVKAEGDSIVDSGIDFFTLDLNEHNPEDKIFLSVVVADIANAEFATQASSMETVTETNTSQTNWLIMVISSTVLTVVLLALIFTRMRNKNMTKNKTGE